MSSTMFVSMSLADAIDFASAIWFEFAMVALAAVVYFSISGRLLPSKVMSKKSNCKRTAAQPVDAQEPLETQAAGKALRQGKLNEAIALIEEMAETVAGHVPAQLAPRLLMTVAKSNTPVFALTQLKVFLGKIDSSDLDAAVRDFVKHTDTKACRRLHQLAEMLMIPKSDYIFEVFAKAYSSDAGSLHKLVDEASTPLKKSFAKAVLESCAISKNAELASEVFEKIEDSDAAALRAVVEKAAAAVSSSRTAESSSPPGDDASKARAIRSFSKSKNLQGAVDMFERCCRSGASTFLYNSILDTCVECGEVGKAVDYFAQAKDKGVADVVSYNTLMKGHLLKGDDDSARGLLEELFEKGLAATHASYHGLLNSRVLAKDRAGAWQLVKDMQAKGVVPNAVTCSILLKCAVTNSAADVSKVLTLVDAMEDPIDEVLFSSVAEACIRSRRLDLLSKQIEKYTAQNASAALSAPTYGSMIKAYGQAYDVKRVWALWAEMKKQGVTPTAVTLGCMVEALVVNRCTSDAWALVQRLWDDESTRPLVNTVIYSTILKGFASARHPQKVIELYEEMKSRGIQPNTITYNTILNAFAQSGAMHQVPALLEDMKSVVPPVEWDIVTYSTIIKGFCSSGNLDRGLDILRDMKAEGKFLPDEVLFNSLLDGCAKEHRVDDALKLVEDMKDSGVAPSNYTLSMLVKLMGRCRRLGQAFSLVETLSREHGVKVNIQVYTCLIQACFNNRQVGKALTVHDQILKENLLPDEMTYTALVRGCLHAGAVDKAVKMARQAYNVGGAAPPGVNSRCLDELLQRLGGKDSGAAKDLLADISASKSRASTTRGRQTEEKSKSSPGGKAEEKSTSSRDGKAVAPWRRPVRAPSTSTASTESGSNVSCSEESD